MTDLADVVVIGGGLTGTSIAWHLVRRGAGRVVLLEKTAIAAGGTGWSSGIVRQHATLTLLKEGRSARPTRSRCSADAASRCRR